MQAQALASVRQLLVELGSARGIEEFTARGARALLERELGLGSLERVELMLRLGDACGVRLPDSVVAEADTVQDLKSRCRKWSCIRLRGWSRFDCFFARDSP